MDPTTTAAAAKRDGPYFESTLTNRVTQRRDGFDVGRLCSNMPATQQSDSKRCFLIEIKNWKE